jgi:hypothetical protein
MIYRRDRGERREEEMDGPDLFVASNFLCYLSASSAFSAVTNPFRMIEADPT